MISSHVSHWSQGFWKLTCKSLQASCPLYVHGFTPNRQRGMNGSPPVCLPGLHKCLALAGSKPELYWPKEPGKCSFQPSRPHKTRKNLKSTDNFQHTETLLCSSYNWGNWVSRSSITLPKFSLLVCGGNGVWISLNPSVSKIRKNEWILIDVEKQIYPSGSWEDISVLGLLIHQPY